MSVVNKMLQDLEARQSQTDEVSADYQVPPKKQSKLFVLVLLILAIAAIMFAITDISQMFSKDGNNQVTDLNTQPLPLAATKKMTTVSKKVQKQQQVQSQEISDVSAKANPELVDVKDEAFANRVLDDIQISPNEPEIITDSRTSLQDVNTQNAQQDTEDSIEIGIQVNPEQASSFSMSGSSQENNTSSLKQRIAESLNNENLDLAQTLLSTLLETESNNIKARKKLASLLFAQGNFVQSKRLLIQGIEIHPSQSDLRLMLARLYVVQKEPSEAMDVLAEFEPSIDNKSEFLAYRAALAQQLKQTKLAKLDYQTLTKIDSTNAKWWLGLGIAEDQLGETNMAIQAYTRASSLNQLQGSVDEFIKQRISVLTGAQ